VQDLDLEQEKLF